MANKTSLLIEPDFTEDTVAFGIQSYLANISFPFSTLFLEGYSHSQELIHGADAKIVGIRPIYIQFKRSFAYPPNSRSSIVTTRKNMGLDVSPYSLFFKLHDKKPHHTDYQHNLLYDLNSELKKKNEGAAVYVAPLFLDREEYQRNLYLAALREWPRHNLLNRRRLRHLQKEIIDHHCSRYLMSTPLLSLHVVFAPHIKVTNAKHRYSYSLSGREICFHSPETLPDISINFFDFIVENMSIPYQTDQSTNQISAGYIRIANFQDRLNSLLEKFDLPEDVLLDKEADWIKTWRKIGKHIRYQYNIEQLGILYLEY